MSRAGVAIAARALDDLAARLDRPVPRVARVGADLWVRAANGLPWPGPAPLLRAADGWVHPGPATAWSSFTDMVIALGASPPADATTFPDLTSLSAGTIDAESAAWMLPAVAVRDTAAPPDPVPAIARVDLAGARVVVLGTAWATPLVGRLLADAGARVVKLEDPRRPDPFPLHDLLVQPQERHRLDLGLAPHRDRLRGVLARADLLVDGHPPRVLANAGLGDGTLRAVYPSLGVLRVAAFTEGDRPGYGPAAEAHGGWAARQDPPRLARSSVADPVAGMIGAITAVALLTTSPPGGRARVSLEGSVGHLLARERTGG